jgi:hypothetical protein
VHEPGGRQQQEGRLEGDGRRIGQHLAAALFDEERVVEMQV